MSNAYPTTPLDHATLAECPMPSAAQAKPARLLVVDDEQDVAVILQEGLEFFGYQVDIASNGPDALALLRQHPYAVMLTDVHIPRMRGDELQRLARQHNPDLIVIIVTAVSDLSGAIRCLKEGVFDYITKPFHLDDVAARVAKGLERQQLVAERARLEAENHAYRVELETRVGEQAERIRGMFQNTLQALNHALEAKDEYTRNHSARVAYMATLLARRVRPDDAPFLQTLNLAALLHDIGKIGVPEGVLNKPGRLSADEYAEIQKHPVIGETILRPLFSDAAFLEIVRHHHEQWDGSGYPDGLIGETIPLGARIVAIADSFDAMTSARPYRAGMPGEQALAILRAGAGEQWDADMVAAFLELAAQEPLLDAPDASPVSTTLASLTHRNSTLTSIPLLRAA